MNDVYVCYNAASPTTAEITPVTTGTSIKTMLQVATSSAKPLRVIEWGIDFDGSPSGVRVELIQTDVAATVTAHVSAGVPCLTDSNAPASSVTLGTSATGYTASAEGTTTASRLMDYRQLSSNSYSKMWPLGREPKMPISKFLRVRVHAPNGAVNAICWIAWIDA